MIDCGINCEFDVRPSGVPSLPPLALNWASTGGCVLAVDDNKQVLELTTFRLTTLGFDVLQAENGAQAIDILQRNADIDLVFTDVVMPGGLSGYDVAHWVLNNRAACRILLTSGGFKEQIVNNIEGRLRDLTLLRKPYQLPELQAALNRVLVAM